MIMIYVLRILVIRKLANVYTIRKFAMIKMPVLTIRATGKKVAFIPKRIAAIGMRALRTRVNPLLDVYINLLSVMMEMSAL
jgi:hypothetical protein